MKYLKIKNTGLLDEKALYLLGASSKRTDETKIGQFGSGNKYALAYLLRKKYRVGLFSGTDEISIDTVKESFRGDDYDLITINGRKTSITTEMGKDWELWQALREIYCNALDEGGCSIEVVDEIHPKENETHFYIDLSGDVLLFLAEFNKYFAERKKILFECPMGRILEKTGNVANIYRKGIRCFETNLNSVYDYDFSEIAIEENRLVKYRWEVEEKIWGLLYRCENEEVIMRVLMESCEQQYIEGTVADYADITPGEISHVFRSCVKKNRLAPRGFSGLLKPDEIHNHIIIPTKIFNSLRPIIGDQNVGAAFKVSKTGLIFRDIEMPPLYRATLNQAMEFFKEVGFPVDYPVKCAIFDSKEMLGVAYEGEIIISDVCFERGVNEVANTILEEYIHLKYGVGDCTRGFQTAVLTEFISYMKNKSAFVL